MVSFPLCDVEKSHSISWAFDILNIKQSTTAVGNFNRHPTIYVGTYILSWKADLKCPIE